MTVNWALERSIKLATEMIAEAAALADPTTVPQDAFRALAAAHEQLTLAASVLSADHPLEEAEVCP